MPRLKNCWACDISSGAGLWGGGGVGHNERQRCAFSGGPGDMVTPKYLKICVSKWPFPAF